MSASQIRARSGRTISSVQRDKLTDAGYLAADLDVRPILYALTALGLSFVQNELGGPLEPTSESPARLSEKERIALFALLSPALQVTNAEVATNLGIKISKEVRTTLSDRGLVVISKGGSIKYELTEKAWQVAEEELGKPGSPDDPPLLRLLHHHYARSLAALRPHGLGLVDLFVEAPEPAPPAEDSTIGNPQEPDAKTIGARVIDAYAELVYEPEGWVGLRRLRDHLADVNRDELDEVLRALLRDRRIRLIAEVNQRVLSDADHAAALIFAGDHKHLYQVR